MHQRTHPLLPPLPPSLQLRGSKAVEAANDRFDATMTNAVRWQEAEPPSASGKQLASDTEICVQLQVPRWFLLPTAAIERTGEHPMQPAVTAVGCASRGCKLTEPLAGGRGLPAAGCAPRAGRPQPDRSMLRGLHPHPSAQPNATPHAGCAVMAKVLDTAVPRFLQQLAIDYAAWAAGDETRQPVASGSLLDDVYEAPPLEEAEQGWD